ncbi:MAG: Glu-tRNA(Gln) amidotransferase subunit GatE [Candidatus Woesearchaeota archaeon]
MDYKKLGFKAGLEIHQQLEGTKLFCSCPTIIRKDEPDFKIKRVLRASAGESGNVDKAAMHELEKSKEFEYLGYYDTTCHVETDDEPPGELNVSALNKTLKLAKLMNMKVVDEIQFMRKTVIDGSNTSGFQRTALIGVDGFIEVNGKKFGIESICLEEEACQVVKRTKTKDIYNLSRLGIPLIEIATAPDMSSPEECKDVAAYIGMLLRSIEGIKRGIGSIRQDVNVSIANGARIEVKGFQDFKNIPKVVEFEVKRQLDLIENKKRVQSEVRKAEPDFTTSFLRPMPGADRMYPETDIETIKPNLDEVEVPLTLEDKQKVYKKKYDLSDDLATQVVKYESKNDSLKKYFDMATKDLTPTTIADIILMKIPDTEKKEGELKYLDLDELFENLKTGKITVSAVPEILSISTKKKVDYNSFKALDENEIKSIVKKIIGENKGAPMGALMGKSMAALKGKADGKLVSKLVRELLK